MGKMIERSLPLGIDSVMGTEEALIESNRRLSLLSETISRLLLTDDPQGLVQSLCENVMAHLDCHAFFNFLVDEERGCLHLNAFAGIPEEVGKSIEWLDYGTAVCGCVARDGCRIIAEDIPNNPDPRTDLVKSYGIQAYACHPLLAQGGRVIGTLSFGSRTRTRFPEEDLALMKTVADHVATAMERIRLLNAERQRADDRARHLASLERLVAVSADVLAATEIDQLLQRVVDAAWQLTGASIGASGYGYRNGRFRVAAASGSGQVHLPEGQFLMSRGGVYTEIAIEGKTLRCTDRELREHPRWWGLPDGHPELRGLLGAPLFGRGGEPIGLIMVTGKNGGEFTEEDEALLEQLASVASLGLQHIEARREAERRAQDLAESESKLRRLVDSNVIGVIFSDASGGIRDANDAFLGMVGYTREEVRSGKVRWSDMTPPEFRPLDEMAMEEAARRGACTPYEKEYLAKDGRRVPILIGCALLEGSTTEYICFILDLTEAKRAQRLELHLEDHKREFYRRTILAATDGKLVITENDTFDHLLSNSIASWPVQSTNEMATMRDDVSRIARNEGMNDPTRLGFLGCVVEAAANALKHAQGGIAHLSRIDDTLFFAMLDSGPGIEALTLPNVALTNNYSTAGTLGMGYKVMLKLADKVYLATDANGTSVGIQMRVKGQPSSQC